MKEVWWSISGEAILAMLYRVANGEDPELVYVEFFANSEIETNP